MDVTESKILAMVLLGSISIILGFIPLKLGKWFRGNDGSIRHGTIFSSLLCFGGGVLLGTSLLHMLPEVGTFKLSIFLHHSQNITLLIANAKLNEN